MRNKQIHLSDSVMIPWSHIKWQLKEKGKMNFILWPQESYQDSYFGYPTPENDNKCETPKLYPWKSLDL